MEGAEPGGAEARDRAAAVVQRTFRRFINVRIYKYYRNLVNFRNRGDPGSVLSLRCAHGSAAGAVCGSPAAAGEPGSACALAACVPPSGWR